MEDNSYAIKLVDVYKSFKKNNVLKGISLEVNKGEIYGFLGPNGAGKTTTIRVLLDIIRADKGYVEFFGESNQKIRKTHSQIGYLSGDMVMDKDLTGKQYLKFVNSRYRHKSMANAIVLSDILKVNLATKIGKLSTGNKQKIGLISALMHNPKLLILDEPSQGFDPLIQQVFKKLIHQFRNKGGTVFMSSHILEEVQDLCDRVCFIKDGNIIGIKSVKEITSSSRKKITIKADSKDIEKIKYQHKALPGLNFISEEQESIEMGFSGDVNKLLDYLSKIKIKDIKITEPALEEVFLDIYKAKETNKEII